MGSLSRRLLGGHAQILGVDFALPGVRLSLWLGGVIVFGAGLLARRSVRAPSGRERAAGGAESRAEGDMAGEARA